MIGIDAHAFIQEHGILHADAAPFRFAGPPSPSVSLNLVAEALNGRERAAADSRLDELSQCGDSLQ